MSRKLAILWALQMCARVTAENYLIKLSRVPHKNQVIASIQLTLIPVLLDNKEQIQ
jgi:hypothetical protein